MTDAVDRLERGIRQTAAIVKGVSTDQLGAPSPCEGWDTRDVINHTIGAMTMFRDTIDNGEADMGAIFSADLVGDDPASSFDKAGQEVVERFRGPGVIDGTLKLPFGEFPAEFGIGLVTNDIVVHGWDIARATGRQPAYDDEITAACDAFCRQTFANPAFRGDSFGAETQAPEGASAMDKLAAYLGRPVP